MSRLTRPLNAVLLAAGLALIAPSAAAEPGPVAKRLMEKRKAERYEVKTKLSSVKAGGARVHVRAPAEDVLKMVTDYGKYETYIKKFETARVVGKKGKETDVYLKVPILKGAGRVWSIVRFSPPKQVKEGEWIVVGHGLKGNTKRMDAVWRIKRIDDANTQLNLEMLMVPKLPVPGSLVTKELKDASRTSVVSIRRHAEAKK